MMESVNCSGDETSLFDCDFGGWVNHDCSHREDAGVRCVPDVHGKAQHFVERNQIPNAEQTAHDI